MTGRKVKYTEFPKWFIEELFNESDKELAREGYLPHSNIVDFYCEIHGVYSQKVSNHMDCKTLTKRSGCPQCSECRRKEAFYRTTVLNRPDYPEWFIDDIADNSDKERARNRTLSTCESIGFICPIHGIYNQLVHNHIKITTGEHFKGCPKCAILKRAEKTREKKTLERPDYPKWFINELSKEEDRQRAEEKLLKYNEKVEFLCVEHGTYIQAVADHLDYKTGEKKQGCPKCGILKRVSSHKENMRKHRPEYPEWFINELNREEDRQRAISKHLTWSDKVEFKCSIHGLYTQRVDAHMDTSTLTPKQGCPSCGILLSKSEIEIYDFIKSFNQNVERRNRSIIKEKESNRFLELDIYIPDNKIAIEYNGSYWHSELYKKDKKSHQHKYLLCAEQGVRLISIYDKDWKESEEKIKEFLKDILSPKIRIYGRQTQIRSISPKEAKMFYDTYHLKGGGYHNKVSYGLFYNDELISAMSFSRPNFGNQKDVEWDLTRYCVKYGYSVVGGAERLFKSFIKEFTPSSIITYSDNDYFTGEVYSKLGFQLDKLTDIPYYWSKGDRVFLNREKCQVKVLKEKYPDIYNKAIEENASNKEEYIMHALGFYKVYRCGNKKWVWSI